MKTAQIGRPLADSPGPVPNPVHEGIHLGVLGAQPVQQGHCARSAGGQQGPVKLVLLLVVTQQVVSDEAQMVLGHLADRSRGPGRVECGREARQLVPEELVGESEADQVGPGVARVASCLRLG